MSNHHFHYISRKMARGLIPAMAVLALSVVPVSALNSGWAETEGGRMRLVIDPTPRDDGTLRGMLDVSLDPGWKTYWRDPGSAGIPPMLDFSQSQGVSFVKMEYPAPVRVDDGYSIWAGYTAPVQFPLTFRPTLSGAAHIRAQAFIGICEKICVPFQAELTVDISQAQPTSDPDSRAVDAAFARLPEPGGADFSLEKARLDPTGKQLTIAAQLPAFRPSGVAADLFVAGPEGYGFAPPKLISDENGLVHWSVRVDPPAGREAEKETVALDVVVTLGQRSIEQRVLVSPAKEE